MFAQWFSGWPAPETRDELQRPSETRNAMLARLESAVNEIKRFTGDASHELRNPVSFIRTTAELALKNRHIDAASRRAFEAIVTECGKAAWGYPSLCGSRTFIGQLSRPRAASTRGPFSSLCSR